MGTRLMMARETATPKNVKSQGLIRSILQSPTCKPSPGIQPRRVRPFGAAPKKVPSVARFQTGNAGPCAAILWILSVYQRRPRMTPPVTIDRDTQCPAGSLPISPASNS